MTLFSRRFWFSMLCLLALSAQAQNTLPLNLRIGLVPNVSANVLMTNYAPVKNFFVQQGLNQTSLNTADNFVTFNQMTRDNAFDLIVTAPHMARLAQIDYRYTALSTLAPTIRALLISSTQANLTIEQMKGATVAFANPQSFVAMIGTKWMEGRGLDNINGYKAMVVPREDNIGRLVGDGEAQFGILSNAELRAVPERFQAKLRVVQVITDTPNFIFLTNPNLSSQQVEQMRSLLQKFSEGNEFSDQFFKLTGFTSLRPITEVQLKPLDAYIEQTRRALASQPLAATTAGSTAPASIPTSMHFSTQSSLDLPIQFYFNSAQIRPESQATLIGLVQKLQSKEAISAKYIIEGHTDANGLPAANLKLSTLRAQAVVTFLVSQGVDASRLSATGKGATQPLIVNNPKARQNRRVTVVKAA